MSSNLEQQIEALLDALRANEQEEKKRYFAAVEIEDMAEATDIAIDARTKIQKLRKWTEDVLIIQKELRVSTFPHEASEGDMSLILPIQELSHKGVLRKEEIDEDDSEELEVEFYIRNKLRDLCQSGYIPSSKDIIKWQDGSWSKRVLNINYAFALIYAENRPLREQIAPNKWVDRYWAEVFEFDSVKLLFCSQWYRHDREYFDRWYENLFVDDDNVENEENFISSPSAPTEFSLFGTTYAWHSWHDVLVKLSEKIILREPYKIMHIGVRQVFCINDSPVLWYSERDELAEVHKLSNGLSLMMHITDNEAISCCEQMLDLCGFDRSELAFNQVKDLTLGI